MAELPQSDILHLINLGQWAQQDAIPYIRDLARADGPTARVAKIVLKTVPKRVVEAKEATAAEEPDHPDETWDEEGSDNHTTEGGATQ